MRIKILWLIPLSQATTIFRIHQRPENPYGAAAQAGHRRRVLGKHS